MKEILREYSIAQGHSIQVDRPQNTIYGVKILGTVSRNKRRYPIDTLIKAVSLYENAKVNIDHPEGNPERPRSYSDRIGTIKSICVKNNDGLYADFHYNPNHPLSEQLLWDAEHAPENVGFSHNVEAIVKKENGEVIVDDILSVRSVDLVADPATTSGLFESKRDDAGQRELLVTLQNENQSLQQMITSLKESLKNKHEEMNVMAFRSKHIQRLNESLLSQRKKDEIAFEILFPKHYFEMLQKCDDEKMLEKLVDDRLEILQRMTSQRQRESVLPTSRSQEPFEDCRVNHEEGKNGIDAFLHDIT